MASTEQTILLKDGRKLGFAEYGAPDGKPVFFFHGIPGSRLLMHPDETLTANLNVRIIAPDRPGIGLSDFKPGYELLDWAEDMLELADALSIDRLAVLGYSGGGPYAVACAYKIPERLTRVGIVSGIGPLDEPSVLKGMLSTNRMGYAIGRWMPWFLWRFIFSKFYSQVGENPESLAQMTEGEPEIDHQIFKQYGLQSVFSRAFGESFRQGTLGPAWEGHLLTQPWGFDLGKIKVPVLLWQGGVDVVVTPAMGRVMAERIPTCEARFLPKEGHLLVFKYWEEIMKMLTTEK